MLRSQTKSLWNYKFLLTASLLLGLPSWALSQKYDAVERQGNAMNVYQECLDELFEADADDDLELTNEEYIDFLFIRSEGIVDVDEYAQLPLDLVTTYTLAACMCSFYGDESNCCVGDNAAIDLDPDQSPLIINSIITFCYHVDLAISGSTMSPVEPVTPAPVAPTDPPTFSPTRSPTANPTKDVTNAPITSTPTGSPTRRVTGIPTGTPTKAPTDNPTTSPTMKPTETPTTSPTMKPTEAPTTSPTGNPTTSPSMKPTEAPTRNPTASPTTSPSTSPTRAPVVAPVATLEPTKAPTGTPTASPTRITMQPTPESLVCVNFQYGIVNTAGFDANAIFNEVDNTLKTGLLIATETVTIDTLNTTFPRNEVTRLLRRPKEKSSGVTKAHHHGEFGMKISRTVVPVETIKRMANPEVDGIVTAEQGERKMVYLPADDKSLNARASSSRHLVFYTEEWPAEINFIIDNPFCAENTNCAIVASTVCVLLEAGDDPEEVSDALLDGIRDSIVSGEFDDAIPPEHKLPSTR